MTEKKVDLRKLLALQKYASVKKTQTKQLPAASQQPTSTSTVSFYLWGPKDKSGYEYRLAADDNKKNVFFVKIMNAFRVFLITEKILIPDDVVFIFHITIHWYEQEAAYRYRIWLVASRREAAIVTRETLAELLADPDGAPPLVPLLKKRKIEKAIIEIEYQESQLDSADLVAVPFAILKENQELFGVRDSTKLIKLFCDYLVKELQPDGAAGSAPGTRAVVEGTA